MTRLTMALVVVLSCLSSANAGLSSRKDAPLGKEVSPEQRGTLFPEFNKKSRAAEEEQELTINDDTEIKLNGRACEYKDVPSDAGVILVELAADRKTILKIHFESKK